MATHSSVLAWRIPGTGEPDGLPSMGSHRVGHDWSDLAAAAAAACCINSSSKKMSKHSILVIKPVLVYIHSQFTCYLLICDFPGDASGKEPSCQFRRHKRPGFNPWFRKILWRRKWWPTPVFMPGKSHERRSLVGNSPWGRKELDTTEVT